MIDFFVDPYVLYQCTVSKPHLIWDPSHVFYTNYVFSQSSPISTIEPSIDIYSSSRVRICMLQVCGRTCAVENGLRNLYAHFSRKNAQLSPTHITCFEHYY